MAASWLLRLCEQAHHGRPKGREALEPEPPAAGEVLHTAGKRLYGADTSGWPCRSSSHFFGIETGPVEFHAGVYGVHPVLAALAHGAVALWFRGYPIKRELTPHAGNRSTSLPACVTWRSLSFSADTRNRWAASRPPRLPYAPSSGHR